MASKKSNGHDNKTTSAAVPALSQQQSWTAGHLDHRLHLCPIENATAVETTRTVCPTMVHMLVTSNITRAHQEMRYLNVL